MNGTGTLNLFNSYSPGIIKFKDRIMVISYDGLTSSIYNPSTNSWITIQNEIPVQNWSNSLRGSNKKLDHNYVFFWNGQTGKILDVISTLWIDINLTNAPIRSENLSIIKHRIAGNMVFLWYEDTQECYLYKIDSQEWITVNTAGKPNDMEDREYFSSNSYPIFVSGDTLIFRKSTGDFISPDTANFYRFSISSNSWYNDIPPLITSNKGQHILRFIKKTNNSKLFFETATPMNPDGRNTLEVFKLEGNLWRLCPIFSDKNNRRNFRDEGIFISDKKVFYFGQANYIQDGSTRIFFDGMSFDFQEENWEFIPSPFGKITFGNMAASPYHLFSYSGYEPKWLTTTNVPLDFSPHSGIMNLNNPPNNQTQKVLYLYKKN